MALPSFISPIPRVRSCRHFSGWNILLFLLGAAGSAGAWEPEGIPVSLPSVYFRSGIDAASLAGGGSIVVWNEVRTNAQWEGIYAQRLGPQGRRQWGDAGVTVFEQTVWSSTPTLLAEDGGGAVIAWVDQRNLGHISAQRLSPSGEARWENGGIAVTLEPGITGPTHPFLGPARMVFDGEGGVIVTWSSYHTGGYDIFAQRLSADGSRLWGDQGIRICSAEEPQMVSDGKGGAIIFWVDYRSGAEDSRIFAQRIDSGGNVLWSPDGVPVSPQGPGHEVSIAAVPAEAGAAIVSWLHLEAMQSLLIQKIDANGQSQWNPAGVRLGNSYHGAQAMIPSEGGAVVTWSTQTEIPQAVVQRVNAEGQVLWAKDGVSVAPSLHRQLLPALAAAEPGGVVVCWKEQDRLLYQRLSHEGEIELNPDGVPVSSLRDKPDRPVIAHHEHGATIVMWTAGDGTLKAQRIGESLEPEFAVGIPVATIEPGCARIRWHATRGSDRSASVERATIGEDWKSLARLGFDVRGELVFEDRHVALGSRYAYRLAVETSEGLEYFGDVQVEIPTSEIPRPSAGRLELRPITPNPVRGVFRVGYVIPPGAAAKLELMDVSGRRISQSLLRAGTEGNQAIDAFGDLRLAPGIYSLRLIQGQELREARFCVIP